MARLRARGQLRAEHELHEPVVRIGRSADNDIAVDDAAISRVHARIEHEGGVWRITDLDSTNGTKLDGVTLRPWQPTAMIHGATIDVGGAAVFDFLLSEAERAGGDAATVRAVARKSVRLTPTEREVLEMLFLHYDEGRPAPRLSTLQEVADRRVTSTAAVKMVLQGLYDKFDLLGDERNKETLALRAQQHAVTRTRY
jgi:pSer/pThr/pTyr-binding forkhead associated (FHA) protein